MPHDDQTELFFWVDEKDQELGFITRAEAHSGTRKIHRSVFLILVNKESEILMQKRSPHKDTFPGYWTLSTSGHVTYPQTYQEALTRETREEIGYHLKKFIHLGFVFYDNPQEREILHIFKANYDGKTKLQFDQVEIDTLEWVKINSLKNWINTHLITPATQQVLRHIKFL